MIKHSAYLIPELPSVRIPGSERLLRLQAASGKCKDRESLFTLHSATGFRQPTGEIEIEKIAGFCHERRMLRTFWLHRVHSMVDMASGEEIADLAGWLTANNLGAECVEADTPAPMMQAPADEAHWPAADAPRQPSSAAAAIDDAMRCALEQNELGIAERLFRIGAALARGGRSGKTC